MAKTVFLFPGQGSQHAGMLHHFSDKEPIAKEVFDESTEVLKRQVFELDGEEELLSTYYVQLSILISSVISARKLLNEGVTTDYVAGHSIGAFAAAVISGSISFKQALKLVANRATLMEQAFPEGYGLAAFVGFSQSRFLPFLTEHNLNQSRLYLANINSIDQMVVAGRKDSLTILIDTLKSKGIQKAKLLNMSVPSHCELLDSVSQSLKNQLSTMTIFEPTIPYASNSTGRLLKTAEAVRKDLWMSVSNTVKWHEASSLIYEHGARIFIEMEPSGVLSKIAASSFPDIQSLGLSGTNTDQIAWLWKDFQRN